MVWHKACVIWTALAKHKKHHGAGKHGMAKVSWAALAKQKITMEQAKHGMARLISTGRSSKANKNHGAGKTWYGKAHINWPL